MLPKIFYRQDNIGQAKYTISYHDGVATHIDGSPFFGIKIFKNKRKLKEFIAELVSKGYQEKREI